MSLDEQFFSFSLSLSNSPFHGLNSFFVFFCHAKVGRVNLLRNIQSEILFQTACLLWLQIVFSDCARHFSEYVLDASELRLNCLFSDYLVASTTFQRLVKGRAFSS